MELEVAHDAGEVVQVVAEAAKTLDVASSLPKVMLRN